MDNFTPLSINTVLQNRYRLTKDSGEPDEETRLRGDSNNSLEEHILGIGGQGAVYLALHTKLKKFFALKQTKVADEAEFLRAFEREAQLLSNLHHPALPKVTDFFEENGSYFLVMDLVPGETLLKMMKSKGGKLPFEMVQNIILQLLDVLNYLHPKGIIHKDIKPENLKLTAEGQLKLLDFGLAKGSAGLMSEYQSSIFGSTPAYASPEQDIGLTTTPQSDLFSAAATIYHLSCGQVPPHCRVRSQNLAFKQPDPLRLLSEVEPQVPLWFARIISESLSLAQNERPASALEFSQQIQNGGRNNQLPVKELSQRGADIFHNLNLTAIEASYGINKEITIYRPEAERIKVQIPPNVVSGMSLQIAGKGQSGTNAPDGDLLVSLIIEQPSKTQTEETRPTNSAHQPLVPTKPRSNNAENWILGIVFGGVFLTIVIGLVRLGIIISNNTPTNPNRPTNIVTNTAINSYSNINKAANKAANMANTASNTSKSANDYSDIGLECEKKGNNDCAFTNYSKSIELNPNFANAYIGRGIAYNNKGNYDQAIRDYSKAIELKPDYVDAYNNRGNTYNEKGNYDQAIRDCSKAIVLNPNLAEAYYNRGIAYRHKGNYDQTIREYNKAIELKPDYADAYINRGVAYGNKGNYDQAIADFRKALQINPNDKIAQDNLERALK